MNTVLRAEEALGYVFRDKELLKQCFTHKSFANGKKERDNERLEFLGDAVLQLAVSESLYLRDGTDEGKMTEARKRFVSRDALTQAAEKAGILALCGRRGYRERKNALQSFRGGRRGHISRRRHERRA